jgi:ferredoxin, 2Fe-2S
MVAAIQNGIDGIEAECGGSLACGTCHVYVDDAWLARLPPASEDELAMLEEVTAPRKICSRLACQIRLVDELDGLTVRIPE